MLHLGNNKTPQNLFIFIGIKIMGRNGYGPKRSWDEMVMGRNNPEPSRGTQKRVGYKSPSRAEPSRAAEPELPSWIFRIRIFVKVLDFTKDVFGNFLYTNLKLRQ